jgi:hypothetical protein
MKKTLKKCVTIEKHGLDYINQLKEKEKEDKANLSTVDTGGKSDFLSEMRKIQLKKK